MLAESISQLAQLTGIMTVAAPQAKKLTRESASKVRTGCQTCKIRHKKCDETRPACRMCTNTGRTCDGYQTGPDRRTRAFRSNRNARVVTMLPANGNALERLAPVAIAAAPRPNMVSGSGPLFYMADASRFSLTQDERHYLNFFKLRTVSQFSSQFGRVFWLQMIPQMGESEPALRHASIAMGALHWNFVEKRSSARASANDPFALQQCNRAISYLKHELTDKSRAHLEIALVTCIMFISFALCQGDYYAASRLLEGGSKLLRDWLAINPDPNSSIRIIFIKAFTHINFYFLIFADPGLFSSPSGEKSADISKVENFLSGLSAPIDNLGKAGGMIFHLCALAMQEDPRVRVLTNNKRHSILAKLQTWTKEFSDSSANCGGVSLLKNNLAFNVLQMWTEFIYIMIAAEQWPSDRGEMKYDMFQHRFERALSLAKELLNSGFFQSSTPTFSIGTGIIPPLFFCAYKCRDPFLRREALVLLRGWQFQEGIWETPTAAYVLEKIIEIERRGLSQEEIVPETRRIESMRVEILPGSQSIRLWFRRSQLYNSTDWESEVVIFS
ncbi:uncharacterized protein TRUGW13939_08116 [Talaromyces rugulosus]|uniref:Zn(2)-C6 fungal-type domain-containing protein n=1 Tax=Talaromyces rugulosus TaxID=121627 RepID=A0A7H8R3Q3_TALRU|nr:uncharacterized protein TRUGW13939_08116 [Talaromyces rugulosus]QKX60970.1 hypothetical protein TRUGW13939_08116 [Talaromyces rugulosus]